MKFLKFFLVCVTVLTERDNTPRRVNIWDSGLTGQYVFMSPGTGLERRSGHSVCLCHEPGNSLIPSLLSYHPMDVIFLLPEIPLTKMPKSQTPGFVHRFTYKFL